MPWNTKTVKAVRVQMLEQYESGDFEIAELARFYGISRKSVYKWIWRYEEAGVEGLADQSRAPHRHPNAVEAEVVGMILELKARWPRWGAPKLRHKLRASLSQEALPAESTVSKILQRYGLTSGARRRRPAAATPTGLREYEKANGVWCADFKGWFKTGDGKRCTPLTISDGYSRYLLRCQGLDEKTDRLAVQPLFAATFREFGLPLSIRTDNGPPFASVGLEGLSALSVWWMRLGIEVERIEPGCPQQNGRHERMHRTLKEATARPPQASLRAQQRAFDRFVQEYNFERPHEALEQMTPASWYESSPREFPERLPAAPPYPDEWQKRRVRSGGQIKWQGHNVQVTTALAGEVVGLEPKDDGLWAVHFVSQKLGQFNERTYRITPHGN